MTPEQQQKLKHEAIALGGTLALFAVAVAGAAILIEVEKRTRPANDGKKGGK